MREIIGLLCRGGQTADALKKCARATVSTPPHRGPEQMRYGAPTKA
jgi:hypothetical protein